MKTIKTVAFNIGVKHSKGALANDFSVVSCTDNRMAFESKKDYSYNKDGLSFEYKYLIEIKNLTSWGEGFETCVSLVLSPKCLNVESINNIMTYIDYEDIEEIQYKDVYDYVLGISMAYESFVANSNDDIQSSGSFERANDYASIIGHFENMFGFFMDVTRNTTGQNGWDLVKSYLA